MLRLLRGEALTKSPNRRYLFSAAAQAMRQVLVDHDRRRKADKRQGQRNRVPLDQVLASFAEQGLDVSDLHEALNRLAQTIRQAEVVMLHFFGGMSLPKVAASLGVSVTTVESRWRFARAWLRDELGGPER